ncbi:MAG: ATP-binding protein [Pirellulales bacterium]
MLYLLQPGDESVDGANRRVALIEQTAARLERALLAADPATRHRELAEAFAEDRNLAGWALRAAEFRLGRTINRIEEAADWLCGCLEIELGASLINQEAPSPPSEVEWRLSALAVKLFAYERRLSEFDQRLEHEKLESLKELAYGASHEINNPLANIAARAQTLLVDERDPERQRRLTAIHRQAMRAHEMIADLMLFARPPNLNLVQCELNVVVRGVVDQLRDLASEYNVELVYQSWSEPIHLPADATQLGVALQAVIVNALEAVGDGGNVRVVIQQINREGEQWAEIAVHDDGPGFSEEVRRHMFDPFFSGREAGRGLGFGLSKCWRIVTEHGGQVVVHKRSGGAKINILLPLVPHAVIQS